MRLAPPSSQSRRSKPNRTPHTGAISRHITTRTLHRSSHLFAAALLHILLVSPFRLLQVLRPVDPLLQLLVRPLHPPLAGVADRRKGGRRPRALPRARRQLAAAAAVGGARGLAVAHGRRGVRHHGREFSVGHPGDEGMGCDAGGELVRCCVRVHRAGLNYGWGIEGASQCRMTRIFFS